ncbi:FUSC family protein [Acidisphaera sp. S103]|uniref:FUSC family protein n=1 Tax=Acidisphaera sp. S103 TaxID=1747223 RepID=UPI00131B0681|nr:FUSC family protein [Acidisphaera sp. S103]
MPSASFSSAPDLARLPIVVNARAISLSEGIRAGLSVAVIIALNEYLAFAPLREAALAALLTCICDPGGPIRRRVPVLLTFALLGAAVTAGFGLLREFGPAVALPLGVFGLFCSSFVRIYGQAPQQLGALLATVQILSLDRGNSSLTEAGILAASFIAGALWAILLTMVIWRIHPFLPARRAVGEAYRKLSELAGDLHALVRAPAISDAAWEAHARIHRRAARDAIEAARTVVMDTLRARGAVSNRAAQAVIRLETADQIFGSLIALSDLLEHASPSERHVAERVLRRMRPLLLILGRGIVTDDPDAHHRIDRSIDAIVEGLGALPDGAPLWAIVDRITERLRIAHTLAVPANLAPGVDASGRAMPFWPQMIRPLRANLDWKSPALRHAVRTGVVSALPLAFTMFWFTPYDHWLTMTVVATMQPYYSLTYTRAIERIAGTAAGGIVAAVVGLVCTTPLAIAGAMFPLAMLAFAVRAVSFGLFMMALTPLVVLLVETGTPGTDEWMIAFVRAAFTILGGLIAVGANFALWPSREPDLVAAEVKNAIAAHGAYAEADFSALLGDSTGAALGPARRAAGVASNALEALITRALLEPGTKQRDALEAAMVVDAALRRCAGRLARLQHDPLVASGTPAPVLRVWRDWIGMSMRLLASGRTDLPPRPGGTENDTLARLARQIELMAGAMERLR